MGGLYCEELRKTTTQHVCTEVCLSFLLSVLRSMVTATAFQILVSNNAAIKATTDNSIVTLEVSTNPRLCVQNR